MPAAVRPRLLAALWLAAVLPCQAPPAAALHGRIEDCHGLRIVRTWGTPQERGRAHGLLLGGDIAAAMQTEFAARFGRKPQLLQLARQSLARLIRYPDDVAAEL